MNKDLFNTMFTGNDKTLGRIFSAISSEDDIGVVLRIHLIAENMLEAFCCAASNNPKFFNDFGENLNMSFAAKLKLASNFGLNDFSYNELKFLNKIRNTRAHNIDNTEISDNEINKMIELVRLGGHAELVDNTPFGMVIDDKRVILNAPQNNNRDNFLAAFGGIVFRIQEQVRK